MTIPLLSGETLRQIILESGYSGSAKLNRFAANAAKPKLGQLLIENRLITPKELMVLLELQNIFGSSAVMDEQSGEAGLITPKPKLGQLLVERGIVTSKELALVLGMQMGVPCIDPSTCQIQPEAMKIISESVARKYNVMPITLDDMALRVAMADIDYIDIIQQVTARSNLQIEPLIAAPEEIQKAIDTYYKKSVGTGEHFNITVTAPVTAVEKPEAKPVGKIIKEEPVESKDKIEKEKEKKKEKETELLPVSQKNNGGRETLPEVPRPSAKLPFDFNTFTIQPEALKLVPESTARKYTVIPLTVTDNTLQVAMEDADDVLVLEVLMASTRMRVEPVVAGKKEIQEAIDRNYKAYGEIENQFKSIDVTKHHEVVSVKESLSSEAIAGAPVVRALDLIIDEAIKNRASDIHIEPEVDKLRLRYRIDGVLHDVVSLPLSAHVPLISRLKILATMNIADHHRPQDGQFSIKARGKEVDVRVATIATSYGEMGVLRILDKSFAALSLKELGFSAENYNQYQNMLKSPFGMIMISGPTGSGKTTSLYASINGLDCSGRNIITIEDPVEYRFEGINQIQVNPRAGLTFASGLRAIMRLDPDVILVGEIRDPETAEIAVQAALTGHLVMASVHANDSVGSMYRLLDLGVPPFLVASALIGCVAQRMVRRICPQCQHQTKAPIEAQIAYTKEMGEECTEFNYGSGCNSCAHTGYLGRVAVFEILRVSDEIRKQLLTGAGSAQMREQAWQEGMVPMWHDGMLKVQSGVTTPCEILRNVFSIG